MASRREETSDSEEESSLSLSDNENLAPPNKKYCKVKVLVPNNIQPTCTSW